MFGINFFEKKDVRSEQYKLQAKRWLTYVCAESFAVIIHLLTTRTPVNIRMDGYILKIYSTPYNLHIIVFLCLLRAVSTKPCDTCMLLYLFAGIYVCPKCGHELFSAKAKYKHNTPWPAFTETIRKDSVSKENETEPQQSSKNKALKVCSVMSMLQCSFHFCTGIIIIHESLSN